MIQISYDGAQAKGLIASAKNLGRAARRQVTAWGGATVKRLIRAVSGELLGHYKNNAAKSGNLRRNIGMKVEAAEVDAATFVIATGEYVGKKEVPYAKIHEYGGTIKKSDKKLTIPFPGVRGRARNYPSAFFIKTKRGNVILAERRGTGIRPLFLLRDSVRIPASHWLSIPIDEMTPLLTSEYLEESRLLEIAAEMGTANA
jgi:hypothetical protein